LINLYEAADEFVASLQSLPTPSGEGEEEEKEEPAMAWYAKYHQLSDDSSSGYECDDQVQATITARQGKSSSKKKDKETWNQWKKGGSESDDSSDETGVECYTTARPSSTGLSVYPEVDDAVKVVDRQRDASGCFFRSGEEEGGDEDEESEEERDYVLRGGVLVDPRKHSRMLGDADDDEATTDDDFSDSSDMDDDSSSEDDEDAKRLQCNRKKKKKDRWQRDWNEEWQTCARVAVTVFPSAWVAQRFSPCWWIVTQGSRAERFQTEACRARATVSRCAPAFLLKVNALLGLTGPSYYG
jgi:hypothetical protein